MTDAQGMGLAKEVRDKIMEHLLMGLTTDGAHHKQCHLEQVARLLATDEFVDKAKIEFGWEEGIPS